MGALPINWAVAFAGIVFPCRGSLQLSLTYVPLSSFLYGQLSAAAMSVQYTLTGSLTVWESFRRWVFVE